MTRYKSLIEFVFIPPYSPTLNAIEPLWKDLKREISPTIFEDKDHFREFVTETFLQLSHRLSFAVDWIDTSLPDVRGYADHSRDIPFEDEQINDVIDDPHSQ